MGFRVLGIGSPLVDYSMEVDDSFLDVHVPGGKGASRPLPSKKKEALLHGADRFLCTPGGSAANSIRIFASLGGEAAFLGTNGVDREGRIFRESLRRSGVDDTLLQDDGSRPSGCCITLVTPDAERTMLFNLADSPKLTERDIDGIDFGQFDCVLLEGYLLHEEWWDALLRRASGAGCRIAMDLNNFELVAANREVFRKYVERYVDILFANEQEAAALFPGEEMDALIAGISACAATSVVKLGENGSLIATEGKVVQVPARREIQVRDTTGAGDYYAGGFLLGMARGGSPEQCGRIGTLCAAEIIQTPGTVLEDPVVEHLKQSIAEVV